MTVCPIFSNVKNIDTFTTGTRFHVPVDKIINLAEMRYGFFDNAPPYIKLLLVPVLMGCSYFVLFFISVVAGALVFHISFHDVFSILQADQYEEHIGFLKFLQIFYSAGLFLIPGLMAGYFIQGDSFRYIMAHRSPSLVTSIGVLFLLLSAVPAINFLIDLNLRLSLPEQLAGIDEKIRSTEQDAREMMDAFLSAPGFTGFLVNLVMIAVIPALGEEFLFRGVIQRILTEWFKNHHIAILVTAFLFSMMHFQFLGFLPRMVLGVMFGYLFVWSRTIWVPVIAHFINNAMAVVFVYLYSGEVIGYDFDKVGSTGGTMIFAAFSTLAVAIMMTGIFYYEKRRPS